MQVEGSTTQTNTCACVETQNYFARLIVSNCEKNSTSWLRSFACVVNVTPSYASVLLAMQ